jgi:hypothetical protein
VIIYRSRWYTQLYISHFLLFYICFWLFKKKCFESVDEKRRNLLGAESNRANLWINPFPSVINPFCLILSIHLNKDVYTKIWTCDAMTNKLNKHYFLSYFSTCCKNRLRLSFVILLSKEDTWKGENTHDDVIRSCILPCKYYELWCACAISQHDYINRCFLHIFYAFLILIIIHTTHTVILMSDWKRVLSVNHISFIEMNKE